MLSRWSVYNAWKPIAALKEENAALRVALSCTSSQQLLPDENNAMVATRCRSESSGLRCRLGKGESHHEDLPKRRAQRHPLLQREHRHGLREKNPPCLRTVTITPAMPERTDLECMVQERFGQRTVVQPLVLYRRPLWCLPKCPILYIPLPSRGNSQWTTKTPGEPNLPNGCLSSEVMKKCWFN